MSNEHFKMTGRGLTLIEEQIEKDSLVVIRWFREDQVRFAKLQKLEVQAELNLIQTGMNWRKFKV